MSIQHFTTAPTAHALSLSTSCFPTEETSRHRLHYHNFPVCCRSALRTAVRTTALLHGSKPAPGRPTRLQSVQQTGLLLLAEG